MNYQALISTYETDVQFPDVSGMEQLDMLMMRSDIEKNGSHLSDAERERVLQADKILLRQVNQVYGAIQSVADLASWRRDEQVPNTHWWWYLDVIVQLPMRSIPTKLETVSVG